VPTEGWDAYALGVSRWLAWHAVALRTAHIRFEVRRRLPNSVNQVPMRFCSVQDALCSAAIAAESTAERFTKVAALCVAAIRYRLR